MSYAGLSAFGSLGASAAQQCAGGEVSDDGLGNRGDFCCSATTFSAKTYKYVKGTTSWRYYMEHKVRGALQGLLAPDTQLGEPNMVAAFAYNKGLDPMMSGAPLLAMRIQAALNNFNILFPISRWYIKKDTRKGKYKTFFGEPMCGPYDVRRSKSLTPTAQRAALLTLLSKTSVSTATMATVKEIDAPTLAKAPITGTKSQWTKVPRAFYDWARKAYQSITSVPTALAGYRKTYKTIPGPDQFLAVQSGKVVPTAWLANFIGTFTPSGVKLFAGIKPQKTDFSRILLGAKLPTTKRFTFTQTKASRAAAALQAQADAAAVPVQPPAPSAGVSPFVIVGVLAAAGVGAYFVFGRKK